MRQLLLAALVTLATHVRACPQSVASICTCLSTVRGLRIQCIDRPLELITQAIQEQVKVERLSVRHSAGINRIPPRAFGSLSIRELELAGNQIVEIDDNAFDGIAPNLVSLSLANNSVSAIPKISSIINLETLDLTGNAIAFIPENAFSGVKKIRRLQFRSNKICKLGPNALIETKDQLEVLDLAHNCLDEVPAQNLRGASKLQYLDLSYNRIVNVPSLRFMNLPSLVDLRMTNNEMEQLHPLAFMNVPNLEQLHLSRNRLTSLDTNRFLSFTKLATLDLSGNELTKLSSNSFQNIGSLKHLLMDNNRIENVETLAFQGMPELRVISLQNNGLRRVYRNAFDTLPGLVSLLLTNNSLGDIEEGTFAGIPSLQQLILSKNQLTSLPPGSFNSVTQLQVLDLSSNGLTTLGANVFQNLNKLFWLDLSGNQLAGLPQNVLPSKVSNLLLNGNPLVCNESIDWLVQYLVANSVRTFLPNQIDVGCAAPPEKRGTLLKDLMLQRANDTYFSNRLSNTALNSNSASIPGAAQQGGLTRQPPAESMKSLSQLAALLGGNRAVDFDTIDLTNLPPEIVRYVSQGGQIPGVSAETMQLLTQRYLSQMASKNANVAVNGANLNTASVISNYSIPLHPPVPNQPAFAPGNGSSFTAPVALVTGSIPLPPLSSFSPDLIQRVLNGETIPGLTPEQTEGVKQHYIQEILKDNNATNNVTNTLPHQSPILTIQHSSYVNFSDLQSLNIDLAQIPPDVLRDMAAGRTPDFGRIPEDIIRTIMEKRPMLFGEIVTRELRVKISPNATKPTTDIQPLLWEASQRRPDYNVNDLDKKADISVLSLEEANPNLAIWTGVCLGAVGVVTIAAVAVLCWRRRVWRMRSAERRQNGETSDTSKFFEHPDGRIQDVRPAKAKPAEAASNGGMSVAAISGAENPAFNIDPFNTRPFGSPCNFSDDPWTSNRPGLNADGGNRINNQLFTLDPINRVTSGPQMSNYNMPPFQAQHFSHPSLPNHPPTQTAVFDHATASWLFLPPTTTASNEYHR